MVQPGNQSRSAPKLDVVSINQATGFGYGIVIAVADQRFKPDEMTVDAYGVGAVLGHYSFSTGRSSPVRSLATSGECKGSGASQSMQRNLRPPVLTSKKRIGLLHFGHNGGGVFFAMDARRLGGSVQNSQSPIDAEGGAVMDLLGHVADRIASQFWRRSFSLHALNKRGPVQRRPMPCGRRTLSIIARFGPFLFSNSQRHERRSELPGLIANADH
jgi:hypothetical protein